MSFEFQYSLLKYVHSQTLGEELNIGILFYFPEQNKVVFKYPSRLNRFKTLYNTFSESHFKKFLHSFEFKARELSEEILTIKPDSLQSFLSKNFIVKDASSLIFSPAKKALSFSLDIENVVEEYFKIYFSAFINEHPLEIKHNENYVIHTYKDLLLKSDKSIDKYLKKHYVLKSSNTIFKADLAWQNHTLNVVKAVGFDLKEGADIADKALLYNAKVNYLSEEAIKHKCRFDLIVSEPRNKALYSSYEEALRILNDIDAPKEIITEDKLKLYSERTISELVRG